jgi:hypothetical protein
MSKAIPIIAVASWLMQMMTGTDAVDAVAFSFAIFFGLLAVHVAGGFKTIVGLLNLVMITKFLLVALVIKTVTWQALDSGLKAPRATAEVMALGFLGLFIGTWLYRRLPRTPGIVTDVTTSRNYLAITIVFLFFSMASAVAHLTFATSYDTELRGGLWGFAQGWSTLSAFAVVPAMYYAWSSGAKRFLSHPLVLSILLIELAYGIASTTKQSAMEPLVCYAGVGFIRYGIKSKAVWGLVAAGLVFYTTIIYPYSQYVRDHGGRDGDLSSRMEVIKAVFFSVSTDSDFRNMVETTIPGHETYLGKESLASLSRMAMVGEADRLIASTDATQSYTGWETIVMGLQLMVPSFIYPEKPLSGGGNLLAHIAGDIGDDDLTTQVSYGVMASLFNSFSLPGVFWGSIIFFGLIYYSLQIWYRNPVLNFDPYGSSIWYILLAIEFQHSLVEAPVGNLLPSLLNTGLMVVPVIYAAKFLAAYLPTSISDQTRRIAPPVYLGAGPARY